MNENNLKTKKLINFGPSGRKLSANSASSDHPSP